MPDLTPAQVRTLQALADCAGDRECAAARLGVKVRTVDMHIRQAGERLGIEGRIRLVAVYREAGWLRDPLGNTA